MILVVLKRDLGQNGGMIMIPMTFVLALIVLFFLALEVLNRGAAQRNLWMIAFLALLFFQEVLIGLRFGYGFDSLRLVQPLTAALIPPMAYLGFRRPALEPRVLVHLWPLAGVVLALAFLVPALDLVVALGNLIYAALLIGLALQGVDRLGWVETHRNVSVMLLMWLICVVLLLSGLADGVIAVDFWLTHGRNTGQIAGWATVVGLVMTSLGGLWLALRGRPSQAKPPKPTGETAQTFAALQALMQAEQIHLDPDINLNRVARRMVKSTRDVSRAINEHTNGNFSQYVNGLRIAEACRLLRETKTPITQVVYASGFNTKSNFNRESLRVAGQSPSEWRASQT